MVASSDDRENTAVQSHPHALVSGAHKEGSGETGPHLRPGVGGCPLTTVGEQGGIREVVQPHVCGPGPAYSHRSAPQPWHQLLSLHGPSHE